MAQTSTTLSGAKDHFENITGTDISFTSSGGVYTISSTTTKLTGSSSFTGNNRAVVNDLITITGASESTNNKTFTVKSIVSETSFTVHEQTATEGAGASITLDHTGFVTEKAKGDGYYSQPDGVHTVTYRMVNLGDSTDDFRGTCKMQGSLATTPTEEDWFDITDTDVNSDLSTTTVSKNFTGNFVWVRAKVTTTNTDGNRSMINSILLNS